ncbi:MAG: hypothetical protein M3032_00735 [Verrucomicrobiota bacterium]|nr:hypothetical protein [Verrucomicrobiota bacterium]
MARSLACLVVAFALASCAAPQPFAPESPPPHAIELQEERAISTMHFRPGLYSLDASDHTGYYYRAREGVMQHTSAGFVRHEGGIFRARSTGRLRGYVIWAGGRTKIGDLSNAYHVLR